jgi:VWFA-related protein
MHSRIARFLAAAVLLALTIPARGQQSGPPTVTFQSEVNYVDVDAIVTDAQGNFVGNLTKDDFQVFEDGKPQKVDMFATVDIPLQRPDRFAFMDRPIPSDARSNREALTGRVYVLVLDDLDISAIRSVATRKQAREFVEKYLGANDVAAVIYTSGRTDAAQEFTGDRQLLLAAIDKFIGRRLRPQALEKMDRYLQTISSPSDPNAASSTGDGTDTNSGGSTPQRIGPTIDPQAPASGGMDPEDFERRYRAMGVFTTLKNVSDYLATVRGRRKAVILISEGVDYPMTDVFGSMSATEVQRALQDTITAAARGNVNFSTIDPRGLAGITPDFIEMAGAGLANLTAQGGDPANTTTYDAEQQLITEMRLSQDTLRTIAEETGGFTAVNTNSLTGLYDRIVSANSRYYVLGYYPPTHPRDGRFHNIEVRMKRPGLKVVARKGYASPRGKTPEEKKRDDEAQMARDAKKGKINDTSAALREVLGSPMQQGGLTFSVQAAAFKNTDKQASVALAIEFDPNSLQFVQANGAFADNVELAFYGIDEDGKPSTGTRTLMKLGLKPETMARVKANGLRVNPRITVAPGRYQVRVGAREEGSARLGSVFYDLQVPDFSKDPLMLSGLLISAPSTDQIPTPQRDDAVAKLLPGAATSRREFLRTDTLSVLAEIYDNSSSRQPKTIDATVRLLAETGQDAFAAHDALANTGDAKKWAVYAYSKDIPLKDVAPGRYLLRVEVAVRGNQNGAKPALRETLITVR